MAADSLSTVSSFCKVLVRHLILLLCVLRLVAKKGKIIEGTPAFKPAAVVLAPP